MPPRPPRARAYWLFVSIRDFVATHAAGLRYLQGQRLADAEQGFNKAALQMSAAKRVKLEALCSRARAVFVEGAKINF